MADQKLKVRGVSLEAVDVAPTAENPAECVTDKGYHSRAVLKALDDSPWKTRISEPKQNGFSRWRGDEAARRPFTNNRVRLKSGVAHAAFKLRAEIVECGPARCHTLRVVLAAIPSSDEVRHDYFHSLSVS